MANITIKALKPQTGILRVKHPVLTETIVDETGEEITRPVELFDLPDGTKGPLELYFVGKNSTQWYDFMKKMKPVGGKPVDVNLLFSKIADESHEFIASLIIGWLDNGAIDTKYSAEEALTLIKNPENFWILEQIYPFLLEESHFFLKV